MLKERYNTLFKEISPSEELEKITLQKMASAAQKPAVNRKRPRKIFVIAAVSALAAVLISGVAYASYPNVSEPEFLAGEWVFYAKAKAQEPIKGYTWAKWRGEVLTAESCPTYGDKEDDYVFDFPKCENCVYAVPSVPTESGGYIEKIAYGNGGTIIVCNENGGGFNLSAGQTAVFTADMDFSASYADHSGAGEAVEAGYIVNEKAYEIFWDKVNKDGLRLSITAEEDGEYTFYLRNFTPGTQNMRRIEVTVE